ncbi:hypothetical protein [Streptomyces avidinii]|uniref:DUF732 domain-containing protein n=1 Tax=Streptomyces avidinii TaxID=1895 RepID=A0ABS4KZF1_STRAV|nr:hypothetical protein [Streptomyces avidinii]MBP2034224.1 hypothetical protein [Streptomyces avidinii]GGZ37660.1 hypothetical protein GCM10010343_75840 [Streptomyces avidinii]
MSKAAGYAVGAGALIFSVVFVVFAFSGDPGAEGTAASTAYTSSPTPASSYGNAPTHAPTTFRLPGVTPAPTATISIGFLERAVARAAWGELSASDQRENCQLYQGNGAINYGLALMKRGKTKEEAAALVGVVADECD